MLFCVILSSFLLHVASSERLVGHNLVDRQHNCLFVKGLHVNLIRFITKEGFHRDLEDLIEITVTNSPIPLQNFKDGQCSLASLINLHSSVYIDPYEIKADPNLDSRIRVLNNWTDLENPDWLAQSNSSIFLHLEAVLSGNLISTPDIKVPIHFRYQKPLSHTTQKNKFMGGPVTPPGYVPVRIPLPHLLLRCEDWDFDAVKEDCHIVNTVCSRTAPIDDKCDWVAVPFKTNSKTNVVWIPVGDLDASFMASLVTPVVVLGATGFIFMALVKGSARLRIWNPKND